MAALRNVQLGVATLPNCHPQIRPAHTEAVTGHALLSQSMLSGHVYAVTGATGGISYFAAEQ